MDLNWITTGDITEAPVGAVSAGVDEHGAEVFVGRALHGGTWTVVTINPSRQLAYGQSHDRGNFQSAEAEFLVGSEFGWSEDFEYGETPDDAVGNDGNVFIGRLVNETDGHTVVGEILANEGFIYCYGQPPTEQYQVLRYTSNEPMEVPNVGDENWEEVRQNDTIPSSAVQAGQDSDGHAFYVGRFWHQGDLVPGIIVGTNANPRQVERITAPWGCIENQADRGMILIGADYSWQTCEDGYVPEEAVQAGVTVNNEPLYVGRVNFMGMVVPGKIHPSHHVLYVGWNGMEHNFREYEVLVLSDAQNYNEWKRCDYKQPMPVDVVRAGPDVVVCRVYREDFIAVVSIEENKQPIGGISDFECLCGSGFRWSGLYKDGCIPKDAMPAGRNQSREMCYIGRATYEGKLYVGEISPTDRCMFLVQGTKSVSVTDYEVLQHSSAKGRQAVDRIKLVDNIALNFEWVVCKQRDSLPENAVLIGWDHETAFDCYVGRFWSDGEVLPASVVVNENKKISSASARQNFKIIRSNLFQVLTGVGFGWQPCRNEIPGGAITSGRSKSGEDVCCVPNYLLVLERSD